MWLQTRTKVKSQVRSTASKIHSQHGLNIIGIGQVEERSAQVAAAAAATWGWEAGGGGHSMEHHSRGASQTDAFFHPIIQSTPTLQIGYSKSLLF